MPSDVPRAAVVASAAGARAQPTADRHFANILRAVGLTAGVLLVARLLLQGGPSPVAIWLWVAVATVALGVGLAAGPSQSRRTLNALALTLLLAVATASALRLALGGGPVWQVGAPLMGVLLTAVFLLAWSWRSQLLLVVAVVAAATIGLLWPMGEVPGEAWDFLLVLLGVGIGSVLGVNLIQRSREALASSEARYHALFEGAQDAILILDSAGRVSECNPAFTALVGHTVGTVVGRPVVSFLSPLQPDGRSGQELFERHFHLALAGEHGMVSGYLLRADGSEFEAEILYSRVLTPQGRVVQAVLRDLTEHRTLERRQQRERRVDAMARLAGGIALQFNNVLTGVLTHATSLRAEMVRDEHAAVLEEIAEAARRGRDLARELLRFARYQAVVLRPVAPAAVLERIATLAGGSVVSGVSLAVELPVDLPPASADIDELVHAGLQLVVNARDAMPGGGKITLSARLLSVDRDDANWPGTEPGDYLCFTVRDTGKGMDAATQDRAFEPFAGTKPPYEAPGVGLAAVHGIVRAHRGAVRIDSTPGHGTAVHMLVPVWKEAPAPATRARPAPVAAAPQPTILVVDDEAIVRHSVNRALSRFGYRVLEAEDADAAAAQAQAADPPVDLVILDIVFPGGARRVFKELRSKHPQVPILLSSGYTSHGDEAIQALLGAGACGFLRKPYEVEELRRTVARALGEADD